MPFVLLGILFVGMKLLEVGPPVEWSWWQVLVPFPLAVIWWTWSDKTGLTQRRAMKALEKKTAARRERALHSLGLDEKVAGRRSRALQRERAKRERLIARAEAARQVQDEKARESILHSRLPDSRIDDGRN